MADLPIKKALPIGGVIGVSPPRTINQARRILSKLITALYHGQIDDVRARTLTYMLVSFVAICKDTDIEQRLTHLERLVKGNEQ